MPYTEVKKDTLYEASKRLLDISFSALILILFSPIILLVMLFIKIDSAGPVFADTPERVGKNGSRR